MLKLKSVIKNYTGRFLSGYTLGYELPNGKIKEYNMASRFGCYETRTPDLTSDNIKNDDIIARAVSLVVLNENHDKVLICKEFRLGVNNWTIGFPGGMVECGETLHNAAERELREETGVQLTKILDALPASYPSPPVTNETINIIICEATGEPRPCTNPVEPIESRWVTKEELLGLMGETTMFSSRMQLFAYMWVNGTFQEKLVTQIVVQKSQTT